MVSDTGRHALEREMEMVKSAIEMVAAGHARRMTVGGLHFGEELLEAAAPMAADAGVRLIPVWTSDERGADVVVEKLGDD